MTELTTYTTAKKLGKLFPDFTFRITIETWYWSHISNKSDKLELRYNGSFVKDGLHCESTSSEISLNNLLEKLIDLVKKYKNE